MNGLTVAVHSFSSIDAAGITTREGFIAWESGQNGPLDIRRNQVLPTPYIAFGKLNPPDKLAFSVASLALHGCPLTDVSRTGIFLAIPEGSLSTDLLYRESVVQGNPSPALFSATLPSSPVADIAIYHHITGPDTVFAGGDAPFFSALHYALMMLQCGRLTEALVVRIVTGNVAIAETAPSPCAYALLVGTPRPDLFEIASLTLERAMKTSIDRSHLFHDRELPAGLTAALRDRKSQRIPVSTGGFIGYISLQYTGKDG